MAYELIYLFGSMPSASNHLQAPHVSSHVTNGNGEMSVRTGLCPISNNWVKNLINSVVEN